MHRRLLPPLVLAALLLPGQAAAETPTTGGVAYNTAVPSSTTSEADSGGATSTQSPEPTQASPTQQEAIEPTVPRRFVRGNRARLAAKRHSAHPDWCTACSPHHHRGRQRDHRQAVQVGRRTRHPHRHRLRLLGRRQLPADSGRTPRQPHGQRRLQPLAAPRARQVGNDLQHTRPHVHGSRRPTTRHLPIRGPGTQQGPTLASRNRRPGPLPRPAPGRLLAQPAAPTRHGRG